MYTSHTPPSILPLLLYFFPSFMSLPPPPPLPLTHSPSLTSHTNTLHVTPLFFRFVNTSRHRRFWLLNMLVYILMLCSITLRCFTMTHRLTVIHTLNNYTYSCKIHADRNSHRNTHRLFSIPTHSMIKPPLCQCHT